MHFLLLFFIYLTNRDSITNLFYLDLRFLPLRFKGGDNPSWLQKQQDKLRARREGKDWEEKHLKEQLLLEELRRTQKKVPNGESMEDVSLGLDFSSSSRETSPPKVDKL